jgi:hypothetical protein
LEKRQTATVKEIKAIKTRLERQLNKVLKDYYKTAKYKYPAIYMKVETGKPSELLIKVSVVNDIGYLLIKPKKPQNN